MTRINKYMNNYAHQPRCLKSEFPHIPNYQANIRLQYNGKINYSINGNFIESYDTREWCSMCKISKKETVMWVLKYGDVLPKSLKQIWPME